MCRAASVMPARLEDSCGDVLRTALVTKTYALPAFSVSIDGMTIVSCCGNLNMMHGKRPRTHCKFMQWIVIVLYAFS